MLRMVNDHHIHDCFMFRCFEAFSIYTVMVIQNEKTMLSKVWPNQYFGKTAGVTLFKHRALCFPLSLSHVYGKATAVAATAFFGVWFSGSGFECGRKWPWKVQAEPRSCMYFFKVFFFVEGLTSNLRINIDHCESWLLVLLWFVSIFEHISRMNEWMTHQ